MFLCNVAFVDDACVWFSVGLGMQGEWVVNISNVLETVEQSRILY